MNGGNFAEINLGVGGSVFILRNPHNILGILSYMSCSQSGLLLNMCGTSIPDVFKKKILSLCFSLSLLVNIYSIGADLHDLLP